MLGGTACAPWARASAPWGMGRERGLGAKRRAEASLPRQYSLMGATMQPGSAKLLNSVGASILANPGRSKAADLSRSAHAGRQGKAVGLA